MVVYQFKDVDAWGNGLTSRDEKDTRVFLDGKLIASMNWNSLSATSWTPQFYWHHVDPTGNTVGTSQLQSASGFYQNITANLDPMGADHGFAPPEVPEEPPPPGQPWEFGSPEEVDWITVDGITAPANHFPPGMLASASRCPSGGCGPVRTEHGWEFWTAYADGYSGYMPMSGNYAGNGNWSKSSGTKWNGGKPTLSVARRRSKSEIARLKEIGNSGIYDNEAADDGPSPEQLLAANDLVDKYVKFFTNGHGGDFEKEGNRNAVRQSLVWLLADPNCGKAFKDATLPAPADVIRTRGLTIAGAGVLLNPQITKTLGFDEPSRKNMMVSVDKLSVQAFTSDNTRGRIYTFYKNSAFSGASYLTGFYALEEIVVHETIHEVGVGKHDYYLLGLKKVGHDLSGYDHYANILKHCRIDK